MAGELETDDNLDIDPELGTELEGDDEELNNLEGDENPEGDDQGSEDEESDEFNPDDFEFEESLNYDGFDLSEFKEKIDFGNDEVVKIVKAKTKEMKDLNFSQDQANYVVNQLLGKQQDSQPQKKTKEDIDKHLKENLSVSAQRNYKAVVGFAKEITKDMENPDGVAKAIAENPFLIELLHGAFKKTQHAKPNTAKRSQETKSTGILAVDKAEEQYLDFVKKTPDLTPEKRKEYINNMIGKYKNKKELTKAFGYLLA